MPRGKRSAFSLIELMCVMCIILVLVSLMMGPVLRAYNKAQRFRWENDSRHFYERFHDRMSAQFGKLGPEVKYPALSVAQLYDAGIIDSNLRRFLEDKRVKFYPFSSETPDEAIILIVNISKKDAWAFPKSELRPPKD